MAKSISKIISGEIISATKSESINSAENINILNETGSLPILKHSVNAGTNERKLNTKLEVQGVDEINVALVGSFCDPEKSTLSENKQDVPVVAKRSLKEIYVKPPEEMEAISSDESSKAAARKLLGTRSNEIQIIKPTSLSPKMSKNAFEECVRTVGDVSIVVDGFGLITTDKSTEVVKRYTFTNRNKMQVQVITLGATVTSIKLPDKNGLMEDIVLGFDSLEEYFENSNPNIGCTLGRDALETLQDEHYSGLGLFNWMSSLDDGKLVLTHISEDGWHGYRGTVMIRAIFELKKDNSLHVSYWAASTTTTPINLSLNLFLNLAGHAANHNELYKHIFTINGDKSINERTYKLSKFKPKYVGGTVYDLRTPHEIGPVIARSPHYGFDKYYILTKGTEQTVSFAARVIHPESGRFLELYTDQGGIQFYTADYFPDGASGDIIPIVLDSKGEESSVDKGTIQSESVSESNNSLISLLQSKGSVIRGKNGANYQRHGSFCMNSLSLPAEASIGKIFGNNILIPGRNYEHRIIYKFGVAD